MLVQRLLRRLSVVLIGVLLGVVSLAQEGGPDAKEIQGQIGRLRREYRKLLDEGRRDDDLRNLLRDLNAAVSASDWTRAAELLAKRNGGPDVDDPGTTPTDGLELPPVRKTALPGGDELSFEMEKVTYEGADGLTLGALVYRPKASEAAADAQAPKKRARKAPGIVLAHGGFRGVPLAYRRIAEALAKVGYVVYAPEFRGQGLSEGKIEYAVGEVIDLISALEQLKGMEGVDPNRIALVGGGHGAVVVLLALARVEGIVCALVVSAPTDLVRIVRDSPLFVRDLKLYRVPLNTTDLAALRERSPLFYATGVQVPVLLLHGATDVKVKPGLAEGYVAVLKARGKEATLLQYLTAGNNLASKLDTFHVDMQNFLAERLKPPGWKVYKKRRPRQRGSRQGRQPGGKGAQPQQGARRKRN